jgi:hypothetical protein
VVCIGQMLDSGTDIEVDGGSDSAQGDDEPLVESVNRALVAEAVHWLDVELR